MNDLETRITEAERKEIIQRLEIRRKLDLIFELAENQVTWDFTSNDILYNELSKIAGYLPQFNEDLYIRCVERGLASRKKGIQRIFYENIGSYAKLKPEEFEKIFYREFEKSDPIHSDDNLKSLAKALGSLLPEHPEVYIRIFEKMLEKEYIPSEMREAYDELDKLYKIDQDKFHKFYERAMKAGLLFKAKAILVFRKATSEELEDEEDRIKKVSISEIIDSENRILHDLEKDVNAPKSSWEKKYQLPGRYLELDEFGALEKIFSACEREGKRESLAKLRDMTSNPNTDIVKIAQYLDKGFDLDEAFECPSIEVPAYEVVRKLGEGGFGKTYLIQDRRLGTKSVLKVCGSKDALDEAKRYAVLKGREIRHVAAFEELYEGENSITINGEKRSAIRVEYIEGKSLREIIEEKGALDKDSVRRISLDVLKGLKELNENGLIHRDVKPENIMVAEDGTAKLIDLNVTSSVDVPEEFTINRLYAAPEGRTGKVNNPNFDYWGFGLTLYEMLAGEHLIPVPDELKELGFNTRTSRYKSIVRQEFDRWIEKEHEEETASKYSKKIERLPKPYNEVVKRCLRKPEQRYQSIDEIINDFSAAEKPPVRERLKAYLNKAVNMGSKIWNGFKEVAAFAFIIAVGYGIFRAGCAVKGCVEQAEKNYERYEEQKKEVQAAMDKQLEEQRNFFAELPHIEVVKAEPQEVYALEPVTLSAQGKRLDIRWVKWLIPEKVNDYETEFNGVEIKHVFVKPGEYEVGCQNYVEKNYPVANTLINAKYVNVFVNPRKEAEGNKVPEVIVDHPEWVKENEIFTIDASKSRDSDGKIERYFIEFGDGEHREGKVVDEQSLVFHHKYDSDDVNRGSSHIHNPMNFCLVLYDDKGGANFYQSTIKVKR